MHKQNTQFDPSQYISKNITDIKKVAHKKNKFKIEVIIKYILAFRSSAFVTDSL